MEVAGELCRGELREVGVGIRRGGRTDMVWVAKWWVRMRRRYLDMTGWNTGS